MKKETKSKILNILFIISLIICLFLISDTYAKYQEQVRTSYQSSVKKWKVVVNNKTIRDEETLSDVITPRLDGNPYMKDDLIVPGREGYFDIDINFSDVDVPFTMDFSVEQNETVEGTYNNLLDFKYYGYSLEEKNIFYYNLPDEYKQLDFLESTGTQYIDTGVKGSQVNKVESKYVLTGAEKPTFNEITYNEDDRNLLIFANYGADPDAGIESMISTKIYGYKIYMDNIIIRELVPCYRISDGVKGMYDMVTDQFLVNSGTGEFADTSTDIEECVIDPTSTDYTDKIANATGYIRWNDGDGTEESPEDELNNTEDTAFIEDVSNTDVKYKASIIFEQYIEE